MTPSAEGVCWNCGAGFKSDLRREIPLILLTLLLGFAFSAAPALID